MFKKIAVNTISSLVTMILEGIAFIFLGIFVADLFGSFTIAGLIVLFLALLGFGYYIGRQLYYDKKTGFEELRPYLDKIKLMVVYGETKLQLKRLMPSAIVCDNLTDAVEVVFDKAQKGDVVLFSPVCASWDQFKNFEERGRLFKELVRNHLD